MDYRKTSIHISEDYSSIALFLKQKHIVRLPAVVFSVDIMHGKEHGAVAGPLVLMSDTVCVHKRVW